MRNLAGMCTMRLSRHARTQVTMRLTHIQLVVSNREDRSAIDTKSSSQSMHSPMSNVSMHLFAGEASGKNQAWCTRLSVLPCRPTISSTSHTTQKKSTLAGCRGAIAPSTHAGRPKRDSGRSVWRTRACSSGYKFDRTRYQYMIGSHSRSTPSIIAP